MENEKLEQCTFCKLFAETMAQYEYLITLGTRSGTTDVEFLTQLKVRLTYNGQECGTAGYGHFYVNFCPFCGRKISKNSIHVEKL